MGLGKFGGRFSDFGLLREDTYPSVRHILEKKTMQGIKSCILITGNPTMPGQTPGAVFGRFNKLNYLSCNVPSNDIE